MNRMSKVSYLQEIKEYKEREKKEIKEIKEKLIVDLNKKRPFYEEIFHRVQLKIDAETGLYIYTALEKRIYYPIILVLFFFCVYNFINILYKIFYHLNL
ncbi:hypothetical protein RB653_001950 [Dictyostelium firmibasis]|uniref:Uncharacterized protein n=1 Tax=Dictyostelium firmibasis TaxID=79012 RepID=A0AAN7TWX0_9MYCE